MARLARAEVFSPDEVAIVHVINRVVRRCYLFGDDPVSGNNYDHRKGWIEDRLELLAGEFGIDLLAYSCLSNHFHLILRSRPDVVANWDDTEVARRWLHLCPLRKEENGKAKEPDENELNAIRKDPQRLAAIRSRLSDISWWMRLLCQYIAQRANREDGETGKFFQARFRAVRILDEQALFACAAYVDLNPIRAALAKTLEQSDFTSVQRRIQSLTSPTVPDAAANPNVSRDRFLAPLQLEKSPGELSIRPHRFGYRCSDKGFLPIRLSDYLELLDWTARQLTPGKRGATPAGTAKVIERLALSPSSWSELATNFGRLFSNVAGQPRTIDTTSSFQSRRRFHLTAAARSLFATAKSAPSPATQRQRSPIALAKGVQTE
mgnify:CR=1 FL=1